MKIFISESIREQSSLEASLQDQIDSKKQSNCNRVAYRVITASVEQTELSTNNKMDHRNSLNTNTVPLASGFHLRDYQSH